MSQNRKNKGTQRSAGLAKTLRSRHFFSLAFGCIIGVGWIVLLGEWLEQAGPLGAMSAFAAGAVLMMLVGLCYAEVATMLPAAGGEVVFAYEIGGTRASFILGWFLALSFIATIAFEAISTGWLLTTMVPELSGMTLYTVRGEPVELGLLLIGLGGMALLAILNYRGLKTAATFQELLTYGLLIFSLIFISAGVFWGDTENLEPFFVQGNSTSALSGIAAVFIMVPFMLSGFEVITQTVEEKAPSTSLRSVGRVILLSVGAATVFYLLCILSASMVMPWQELIPFELPVAAAFETAFRSSLIAKLVLLAGLCGLLTTWNTCYVVATRIIFALGRARIIAPIFGRVHPVFKAPVFSVAFVGITGSIGLFLGEGAIVPIVNVASVTIALAYAATCFVLIKLRIARPELDRPYRVPGGIVTGVLGLLSCLIMISVALFQPYLDSEVAIPMEWRIILVWSLLGVLVWMFARRFRRLVSEKERYQLLLGTQNTPELGVREDPK